MKFLFDLFPVILFFVAFKLKGIYVATAAAIAATFVQVGWLWLRGKRIDGMLWASLAIIVVFGGATLLLHDETFIKWKPTGLYGFFGAGPACRELVCTRIRYDEEARYDRPKRRTRPKRPTCTPPSARSPICSGAGTTRFTPARRARWRDSTPRAR